MAFNILGKQLSDTCILHLVDPSTNLLMYADEAETEALTIELYGRSSKQYRNWLQATVRKAEQNKNKKSKSLDETMADNAEFLAAVSKSAQNFDMDGEPIDSQEAFKKLYSNPKLLWIGEQVTAKLNELESFLQK